MVVVRYVDHVVCVNCSEGCETVADYGEKGDEDGVDYVDDVDFATAANVDPADEEEDPGEAKERDEGCVEGYKEAESCEVLVTVDPISEIVLTSPNILSESLERTLHLGSS